MQRTVTAIVTARWLPPAGMEDRSSTGLDHQTVFRHTADHSSRAMHGRRTPAVGRWEFRWARHFCGGLIIKYVPASSLRWLQGIDGIAFACLMAWGLFAQANRQHYLPSYKGSTATLEIAVRTPTALQKSSSSFFADFVGGYSRSSQLSERTREETSYSIIPFELQVISVHEWLVKVNRTTSRNTVVSYTFQLPLRDYPKGNLPWSDWIEPLVISGQDWAQTDDVSLRYRWVLTPVGQSRN